MDGMQLLQQLRAGTGRKRTTGLPDDVLRSFIEKDDSLKRAIEAAVELRATQKAEGTDVSHLDEAEAISSLQQDWVNFYDANTIQPYVALAAAGPWVITTHGAVLHDSGGYGMLGLGHAPQVVLDTMSAPWVMANIMTPSVSQRRLGVRLRKEVGQKRGSCPYDRFIAMNSGSEAVTVALRITDIQAKNLTAPGARYEGQEVRFLALRGAFHGRTDRPGQVSHSSLPNYKKYLHSFQGRENLLLAEVNDVEGLKAVFKKAEQDGIFIEAMLMEPVMGEGNPGMGVDRAFYDAARELTKDHGSFLIMDGIQAGLRGTGYLSIIDYPGFEDCEAPDLETYSKALNAGQFPLSILACNEKAASTYVRGVYGNTMTTNPRALEVACTVLDSITPELRLNIQERGAEFVAKLKALGEEFEGAITKVQGTGLLLSAELDPTRLPVVAEHGVETWCRENGIVVIHGGKNALRFTPHFAITSEEIDLIIEVVRASFRARLDLQALPNATVSESAHA